MDSLLSAALEEICAEGPGGISIRNLWMRLQSHLSSAGLDPCNAVKQSIWNNLLNVPGMKFQSKGSTYGPQDALIRNVEASEQLGLKIVAPECLRDCFLGLTDQKLEKEVHRRILERIAVSRTSGVTQRQLSKEFGMKGNNIFYPLKNLECRQLIVRRSTILRMKGLANEEGMLENDSKSAPVATNLIHLCRYAKHLSLNPQQRLEITKCDKLESPSDVRELGDCSEENVLVKDFVPAMKAICDKLEEASGKVLVVSDIKQALGYRKTPGHRAWRNICNRLKDARLVEEFRAEVNNKVVNCLCLLKKFDVTSFWQKSVVCANDDFDTDQPVNYGKICQKTDQLVELPIAHQIYDMVEAAGSKGITLMEVGKRLGLKINYTRFNSMFSRFGIRMQTENHNKSTIYRIWTSRNFNLKGSLKIDDDKELAICGTEASKVGNEIAGIRHDVKTDVANEAPKSDTSPVETSMRIASISPVEPKRRVSQRYPCLPTAISIQREQRILQKLQDEKFILTAELHRWLEGLEKDKPIPMARKTLARLLNKLQQEGHCRCVSVSVPVVTNCGRSRITEVVLHPSVEGLPPELLCQIHEKLRLFDMQSRGYGLTKSKKDETVPVLTGIERTSTCSTSDTLAKAEAMRANGFVPAKLIRAKLLHNFLWGYLCSLPNWHDALSSGKHGYDPKNPESTCQLFALDAALKAMPLELFLQVAGSAKNFEDFIDGCRRGLCLSDLPMQDYKSLLTDNANERLSRVIDILIRLKLIRLVSGEHEGIMDTAPCAILTHAMELKPYIEEPLFRALRSSRLKSDLRPRIRHDFILSNKEAVDAYWNTLEYCYAAADPIAASHAFPGSAVNEVFQCRSWVAVRVMSAEQRAELLKRVANIPDRRIPFKDCVKIARELNLSLEQVLRLSYDRRRSRLPLFQGERERHQVTKSHGPKTRKRKRSSKNKSLNHVEMDIGNEELSSELPQCDNHMKQMEQQSHFPMSQKDDNIHSQACDMDSNCNAFEEFDANDGESSFVSQFAFSMLRPTRRRKFAWTEKSDRQLIVQYVRHRAALGPRYHRVDWTSISDLPAPPDTCRRRMAMLNSNPNIRRAVMKVCSLLGERYVKHLDKINGKQHSSPVDSVHSFQNFPLGSPTDSQGHENNVGINFKEYLWDDFEEENIKMAIDEVICSKRMAKPETSGRIGSSSRTEKEWSDLPESEETNPSMDAHDTSLLSTSPDPVQGHEKDPRTLFFVGRSRSKSLHDKFQLFLSKQLIRKGLLGSLSVANAIELLKVAFLSTSTAPEVPKLLEETLRRYSEHDIISAFNYLKEKKFMVIGHGSQPFIFSQRFWHHASSSPFPVNTGKRAMSFAKWLHKKENELESETNLSADLQCGDILHLFALVTSGELFISPQLPAQGIGEPDEQVSSKSKRKPEKRKSDNNDEKSKKLKGYSTDSELFYRREKGFPGIKVSVTRAAFSRSDSVEWFTNDVMHMTVSSGDKNYEDHSVYDLEAGGTDFCNYFHPLYNGGTSKECLWEAISRYTEFSMSSLSGLEQVSSFLPKLFETIHIAICNAGEEGLNMEEVSQVIVVQGEGIAEFIVDILQTFGLVVKVNAYECVRVLDASYGPKYFLNRIPGCYHCNQPASIKLIDDEHFSPFTQGNQEDSDTVPKQTSMSLCDGHKVTILDVPDEGDEPHSETQCSQRVNIIESYIQEEVPSPEAEETGKESNITSVDLPAFMPILPWLNGDGSTNTIMYRGLTRRILGLVMQNPGISEDDIIHRMDVLNPQSCRKLLELLALDNHIFVREMHQTISCGPPAILGGPFRRRPVSVFCKHYFANPMCASLL